MRIRLDERDRIARELHDSTSQLLTALELQLMRLKRFPSATDDAVFEEIMAELGTTLSDLHLEVRAVGRASHFDADALARDLPAMAKSLADRTGVRIDLQVAVVPAVPHRVASALYRVAQEALANACRHARPERISVSLAGDESCVVMTIEDDGVGFDASPAFLMSGRGIANMTARLNDLGGDLTIRSLGRGTLVKAIVPLTVAEMAK